MIMMVGAKALLGHPVKDEEEEDDHHNIIKQ